MFSWCKWGIRLGEYFPGEYAGYTPGTMAIVCYKMPIIDHNNNILICSKHSKGLNRGKENDKTASIMFGKNSATR